MLELMAPIPKGAAGALLPENADSFWEGVLQILSDVMPQVHPALTEALKLCVTLMLVIVLLSVVQTLSRENVSTVHLAGTVMIGILLFNASGSMIDLAVQTIRQLSEYGKLLLPVMTAAMAAAGGPTTSAALYGGTALFDAVIISLVSKLLIPMIYAYLCLSVGSAAIGEEVLKKLQNMMKWLMTWSLKLLLYLFTGYMGITGVVSGTTDAAAVKAAKLTISGVVPVVGSILSDASEAVLVSADVVKNAAGITGLLAILAICFGPFLQIGIQYLLLKGTAAACGLVMKGQSVTLIESYSTAMGLLLAMTGSCSLILLISTVCFMKGVG